jgi:hypothetical protein
MGLRSAWSYAGWLISVGEEADGGGKAPVAISIPLRSE